MGEYFEDVPTDRDENLQYRLTLREKAVKSSDFRKAMMVACRDDVLFWLSAWCWVFEPRKLRDANGKPLPQIMPFIPWSHQVPIIRELRENLGYRDIGIEKSRGEGASWIGIMLALHDWIFQELATIGIVSKDMNAVDKHDDPDSVLWKAEWQLSKLPPWMVGVRNKDWKRSVTDHSFTNLRNRSTIVGSAATGDVASGGRKLWFLMDELAKFPRGPDEEAMASTQFVTESRLVVSTPKGADGAYYKFMHEPSDMLRLTLDWRDNPSRNLGLYRYSKGQAIATSPETNPLPPQYDPPNQDVKDRWERLLKKGFKLEGTVRSEWYDRQCDRPRATPQSIAQELDRNYGGSRFKIFHAEFFERADDTTMTPWHRGHMDYNKETLDPQFSVDPEGPIRLWTALTPQKRVGPHQFVMGADISTGLGGASTSNSVVVAFDQVTQEQVLELATSTMPPADFADLCVAIAKWLNNAFLAWEHNGPGAAFTKRVLEMNYDHLYHRQVHWKRGAKVHHEVGWVTRKETKEMMFDDFQHRVKTSEVTLRSRELVAECQQYVRLNGKIEHVQSATSKDDATSGEAHGDRVIAGCVALQAMIQRPASRGGLEDRRPDPPSGTLAARMREWEAEQQTDRDPWDETTSFEMAHGKQW